MKKFITHVGMDTDSRGFDIAIAEGFGSDNPEVRGWGRIPATLTAVDKLIKQLRKQGYKNCDLSTRRGPCGFGLYRHLQGREGIVCALFASIAEIVDARLRINKKLLGAAKGSVDHSRELYKAKRETGKMSKGYS